MARSKVVDQRFALRVQNNLSRAHQLDSNVWRIFNYCGVSERRVCNRHSISSELPVDLNSQRTQIALQSPTSAVEKFPSIRRQVLPVVFLSTNSGGRRFGRTLS